MPYNPFGTSQGDDFFDDIWRDVGEEEPMFPWMSAVNRVSNRGQRRFLSSTERFNEFYNQFKGRQWDDPTLLFQNEITPKAMQDFYSSFTPREKGLEQQRFMPQIRFQF